jgi:hypothetical protein
LRAEQDYADASNKSCHQWLGAGVFLGMEIHAVTGALQMEGCSRSKKFQG